MAETPSRSIMLFGTEEPAAETRLLVTGPLSAELDAGNLRYIRHDGREAIRAISYLVRDQLWGTFNPEIRDLEVEETGDRFTVTYSASCSGDGQRFDYRARITGNADGTLRFEGIGTPATDFLTNRTGFVVLHGVEGISGNPVEVTEVDGRVVETRFPEIIDPVQPIMNIRALTHEVAPGLKVICTMLGDTFEMEDQRNWTDASYKTYVRPLGLPHPFILKAGETIEQAVELSFEGTAQRRTDTGGDGTPEVTVAVGRADRARSANRHGSRVAVDRRGGGSPRAAHRPRPGVPELLLRRAPCGFGGHAGLPRCRGRAGLEARAGSGGARPRQPGRGPALHRRHGERRGRAFRLGRGESGGGPGLRHPGDRVRRHVAVPQALCGGARRVSGVRHRRRQLHVLHGAQPQAAPRSKDWTS